MRFLNTNKFKKVLVVTLILAFVVPAFSSAMVSADTPLEPQAPNPKPSSFSTGPQAPLADPHPFWVNFYDTTVSTGPNYPDGWAQAVDGNMNYYAYRGFIIPNVLTVVDEYYFHAAPIEHWGHSIQDIKIRISLNAYLWNWDLGFCNISIKNFNTDEWEVLRARVDTHDYEQVLHEFDKYDLAHSGNLYAYINAEGRVAIQINAENYGWWQGLIYWPPGVTVGIDMATVEVLFADTPDMTPPRVSLNAPSGPIRGSYYMLPSVRDDETRISKVEFYVDGALIGTDTTPKYSYLWDTTSWADGSHEVKVKAYNYAGLSSETSMRVTVDNVAEKIAVFFWSSIAFQAFGVINFPGEVQVIGNFANIIRTKGYTKFFFFEDTHTPYLNLIEVANHEGTKDTVFFYLWGHGSSDGENMSYTWLNRDPTDYVTSTGFKFFMDNKFDSPRIGILVESCQAGGWVKTFEKGNYMAISSTDLWQFAHAFPYLGGYFSWAFFFYLTCYISANNAFPLARNHPFAILQNAQMVQHDSYDFFA